MRGPHDEPPSESGQGVVEGYEMIPPGQYEVSYQTFDLISPFGVGDRIRLWFVITDGPYEGIMIPLFCPVRIVDRKAKDFGCRKGSKYVHIMRTISDRQDQRPDRLPPSLLKGVELSGKVVTVESNKIKKTYDREDCYSKIESLERVA